MHCFLMPVSLDDSSALSLLFLLLRLSAAVELVVLGFL